MLESAGQERGESLETSGIEAGRDDQHRGESGPQVFRGTRAAEGQEGTQSGIYSTSQGRPQVHEIGEGSE